MKAKEFFASIGLLVCFAAVVGIGLSMTGCQSNRTLDPSGPYMGDHVLYQVDGLIIDINEGIKLVNEVAARNPGVAARPEVAEVLAKVRRLQDGIVERRADGTIESFESLALLIVARDAYAAVKSQATAQELMDRSTIARAILNEARALLPLFVQVAP